MKLKTFYKSIIRYPISTALNVLSLVIAFSGIITLILYVSYEKSFDKYNENYETVYKLTVGEDGTTVPAILSPIIRKNTPDIEAITPLWHIGRWISKPEVDKKETIYESYGAYVRNDIFDIFTFNFIFGNKKDALTKPNSIVLTQSLSDKLFGNINPIGETVNVQKQGYTCTAVIADLPDNSSLNADFFTSFVTLSQQEDHWVNDWSEWSFRIFLKINKPESYQSTSAKINEIQEIQSHINDDEASEKILLSLHPLKDLHYGHDTEYKTINPVLLNVLLLLALILAMMGAVNFINLMTSQSLQRAKVFSIKRVLGATRIRLIAQIILESVLFSLFALFIAFSLHSFLYPLLENILQIKGLAFIHREKWYFVFVLMAVLFGVIAGFYPAKYITSVDVAQSVKGGIFFSGKGKTIRNILFILQFSFTILLIIGAIAIEKQITFWHNYNTGIPKENILYLGTTKAIKAHEEAFTKEVLNSPNITEYTYAQFVPGGVGMRWGRTVDGQQISLWTWPVDEHFIDFFDIKIEDGRKFSDNIEADKNNFILNRAAVAEFQWKNPTERIIPGFGFEGKVVGVTKDFNFASLKYEVQPMALWLTDERHDVLFVKADKGDMEDIISHLERTWNMFEKEGDFNYHFLDEFSEQLYKREEGIAYFIEFVALWSILLSLTGLLGLALFMARQRTKEIGIRRANGASVGEILILLNRGFIKWILLAFLIASPIAYYAIDRWMENFAYKMTIGWWLFALAGVMTLLVSVMAVSIQTYKVARKNPVEALRYE